MPSFVQLGVEAYGDQMMMTETNLLNQKGNVPSLEAAQCERSNGASTGELYPCDIPPLPAGTSTPPGDHSPRTQ